MSPSQPNVVVVGAGPTGLITALGLARSGIDVTVLERAPAIVRSPRAAVYHWAVLEGLERLGILADVKASGFTNTELNLIVFRTGERIRLNLTAIAAETRHPYNVHLGQERLADIALTHLLRFAHARVHWNTEVTAIRQQDARVRLEAATPEGRREFSAAWVIGADGGRSGVRQALGLEMPGMTWPERFVATNIRYDFSAHDYASANMVIDGFYGAIVARLDSGLWRVTYCEDDALPEDSILERMPAYFQAVLPGTKHYELVEYSPYRMHQRAVESMRHGRVLLAGDAAHITNPTGGLGLTCGLFDAYVLYEALAAVIEGRAPESVLDRYAQERRQVFLERASPEASEFKRLVYHRRDRAQLESELDGLRAAQHDPALQRAIFRAAKRIETPSVLR